MSPDGDDNTPEWISVLQLTANSLTPSVFFHAVHRLSVSNRLWPSKFYDAAWWCRRHILITMVHGRCHSRLPTEGRAGSYATTAYATQELATLLILWNRNIVWGFSVYNCNFLFLSFRLFLWKPGSGCLVFCNYSHVRTWMMVDESQNSFLWQVIAFLIV